MSTLSGNKKRRAGLGRWRRSGEERRRRETPGKKNLLCGSGPYD
jgi:hypothetical protein